MKTAIFACTIKAYELAKKLESICKTMYNAQTLTVVKCSALPNISEKRSLGEVVGDCFGSFDALLFVCATGIAVRSIAPYINHKGCDPAVIVIDECGKFCISLLSGHHGGANSLAEEISETIGAIPVITTATDREGKFAIDDFARKNNFDIADWDGAKKISVAVLGGKKIGIYSELSVSGNLPEDVYICDKDVADVIISYKNENKFTLFPKIVVAGVGCKKGTSEEKIKLAIKTCLDEENINQYSLATVASIDLKKNETGIVDFCKNNNLPFATFSADELKSVEGDFAKSDFVESVTGVSNVCERSAVCASKGRLICKKKVYGGVTVALAIMKGSASFE